MDLSLATKPDSVTGKKIGKTMTSSKSLSSLINGLILMYRLKEYMKKKEGNKLVINIT